MADSTRRPATPDTSLPTRPRTGSKYLLAPDSVFAPSISVVLSSVGSEAGLEAAIDAVVGMFDQYEVSGEAVVFEPSSTDIAAAARARGAVVVAAESDGLILSQVARRVRGEYVAVVNAEGGVDPAELASLFACLGEGADLAVGRRNGDGSTADRDWSLGMWVVRGLLNAVYGAGVRDPESGAVATSRELLADLAPTGGGELVQSALVLEAASTGRRVDEVPVSFRRGAGRGADLSGWAALRFAVPRVPADVYTGSGLAMVAIGVVVMVAASFQLQLPPGFRPSGFGVRSMVAGGLLTLVGYQLGWFGAFAAVAARPVRRRGTALTTGLLARLRFAHGVTFGVVVLAFGAVLAGWLLSRWLAIGDQALPGLTMLLVAFTAIVLGLQTVVGAVILGVTAAE